MRTRDLGASGIKASVVAFGAWAIGGWMWGGVDEADAIKAIHAALDQGINFIDTAPVYGFGRSEEIVGKALQGRREKAVLATKCGLVWDTTKGSHFFDSSAKLVDAGDEYKVYRYLGPAAIRKEVEASLKRLKTDHIDLMQTHWQDSTTPIAETMAELMKLKKEGKIRSIGCSNATVEEMDAYRAAGQLDVDQEYFNMLGRDLEPTNLAYCAKNNVAMLAYSPLAQGLLTGKITPDRVFKEGDQRLGEARYSKENLTKVQAMLNEMRPIADAHKATLGQLAIAWSLEIPGCSHALVGARDPKQVDENARAGDIVLKADEMKKLDEIINRHKGGIV